MPSTGSPTNSGSSWLGCAIRRQTPANPAWSFTTRIRQMKTLLSDGVRAGEIHVQQPDCGHARPVHHR